MKRITFTLTLLIILTLGINAQVLVNQVWTTSSGQPDAINFPISEWEEIDWKSSITTSSNELIIVGNTLQSAGNTDILITKQNNEGQILWEHTFAGTAGSYDYGLTVTLDNNQNVLVAGVVTTSNQTTDIPLLKYSPSGSLLWSSTIDGGNNQFDVATSLVCDASNNIYLVGGTISLSTQSDWYITKFNSSGTQLWNTSYDYANLHELPLTVKTIGGGNIAVGGFSNSSVAAWDFAELRFSGADGSVLSENREEIPDLSISDAVAIASDDNSNIYIAGTTTGITDGNKNIQLIKINSTFDIEWIKKVDAEGLEDKSKSIAIDNEGNIIVAGNSKKTNNGTQITISKFTPDGELKLRRDYLAPTTYEVAEVSKIKTNDAGEIFVAGSVERNGSRDFVTLMYDSEGTLRIEKYFGGEGETKDIARNIEVTNSGEILVTGKSEGNETKYTTVKYEILKRSDEIVLVDDKPHHRANEFIVKFLPQYVNTDFVDDRTKRYGSIYDILEFEAAEKIADRIELRRATFAKVFPRLSTSHTQSTTRLDETIPMPEFWSVFLVVLEEGQDIDELITQFEEMTDFVVYAHPNHVYEYHTIPNDALFTAGDQSSLFPSAAFPNAHINVEPAWDIETGQNYVRVGVFDAPILWSHEDFGDGTLEGSQITDGFDFVNQTGIAGITDPANSHGTATGGIIGALRDNGIGIAGIAGGGLDANGGFNDGVALHSMAIGVLAPDDVAAAQGIVEGAMDANAQPAGFAQHIQNHSWGGPGSATLETSVEFAWRNECVFVASRGNDGVADLQFPACYDDGQVLNIGGSGTNGEYFDGANGLNWIAAAGLVVNGSSWDGELDIIAPYATENVMSLINPNFPWTLFHPITGIDIYPAPVGAANNYQVFSGTSSAAPHVSGVAALMYSRHHTNQGQPNNLAPEDIEFLVQEYATDIVNPALGYNTVNQWDARNGNGLLNAFETVQRINGPQWQVFHNNAPDNVQQTTAVNQEWQILTGVANLPAGVYYGDRVTITHTYLDVFSPTTQIIDNWIRWSATDGVSAANPVSGALWADFDFTIENNVASVTVTTNALHITSNAGGQNLDIWYPAHPDAIRTAYSLHLFDPQATSVKEISELGSLEIFPNPTEDNIRISYALTEGKANFLQLRDITGKLLHSKTISNEVSGEIIIDLSNLSGGMYLCQLHTDKGVISRKVIKQ